MATDAEDKAPQYDPMEAGRRVAGARQRRGWSQAELARRAGLSDGYVSSFEKGEMRKARRLTLEALARALGHDDWGAFLAAPVGPEERDGDTQPVQMARQLMAIAEYLLGHHNPHSGAPLTLDGVSRLYSPA